MAYSFRIEPAALKRRFAVYVVVAQGPAGTKLYVGKTGDNRVGCNPIISRCGNHFSYNTIHSQVRNKVEAHEDWDYTYVFEHFDEYTDADAEMRTRIDRINEMERWLNQLIQPLSDSAKGVELMNPFAGRGYVRPAIREGRAAFRTPEAGAKLDEVVREVQNVLSKAG